MGRGVVRGDDDPAPRGAHDRAHAAEVAGHHGAPGGHRLHQLRRHGAIVVAVALQRDPRDARGGQQAGHLGVVDRAEGGGAVRQGARVARARRAPGGRRGRSRAGTPPPSGPGRAAGRGRRRRGRRGRPGSGAGSGKASDQGELVTLTARAPAAAKRAARSSLAVTTPSRRRGGGALEALHGQRQRQPQRARQPALGARRLAEVLVDVVDHGAAGAGASHSAAGSSSGSWTWYRSASRARAARARRHPAASRAARAHRLAGRGHPRAGARRRRRRAPPCGRCARRGGGGRSSGGPPAARAGRPPPPGASGSPAGPERARRGRRARRAGRPTAAP